MEDFVPFELAKKLEEKGFKENHTYCDDNTQIPAFCQYTDNLVSRITNNTKQSDNKENCVDFSQVLKWLRKEKHIYVYIDIAEVGWFYNVAVKKENLEGYIPKNGDGYFTSLEITARACIEYILDNLI